MAVPTVRRSPYKDFLQPALQRRFATASLCVLAVAYVQALLLANWTSLLWSWFPLGPTGIRTVFFFFCTISIIILRIAQYHPGLRTSDSAAHTFFQYGLTLPTVEALFTYSTSAYLFSQIYLWSLPEGSGFEWITYFMSDRARLNEKPILLTTHLVLVGIYQALRHLYEDVDRLSLGVARPEAGTGKPMDGDASIQVQRFKDQLPGIVLSSVNQSILGFIITLFVYPLFLRATIWRTMMTFLRPIYKLPRTNMVPTTLPFSFTAILRCWFVSLMILLAWTTANTAFSLFLVKSPLKNGKPLTTDSKDPNGSLLNGLKNKKLSIKCFAMWELALIARDFPERRKAIYEDIDRKDGPMWSQVYKICLDVLKSIDSRIDAFNGMPAPPDPTEKAAPLDETKKRTTEPPKNEAIFEPIPSKRGLRDQVEKVVNQVARSPGQGSQLSPLAKKATDVAGQGFITLQKKATGSEDTQGLIRDLALKVLRSGLGRPFRQHYSRRLMRVVLGDPYGEPSLYINAACALSQLAVHSLREDRYGHVQRDIAAIMRAMTEVTKKLETFREELPTHWTDVEGKRECPEVDDVLATLKDALGQLIEAFGPYARDLRLSLKDMRLAREAAGIMEPAVQLAGKMG